MTVQSLSAGYQDIIRTQAETGFHYAGFVPVKSGPSGKLLEIDLVFQTE
ncbi:MAG: hypothetical protein LKE59_09975 [Eubacterium sp.]|jgi:hypothetical protein|nr:hypothetical protein [Eubacterium sp.]MCH4078477.1 hypothetical protein [Eubacterium sp.]MCI1405190.1 hypothetical protein [Eubacterium sp.]MCI1521167.1 hypothetical protein [Eubacterium sp.]